MAKSPQQIAEKWGRRLSASQQDIIDGVNAVQENPAQKAIASKAKMKQNWLAAIDGGKWETGLSKVSLSDWKNAMIQKGVNRISQGVTSGQPKMQAYMTEAMPVIEQLQKDINSMPSLTIEDSIARSAAWIRGMKNFGDNR